MHWEHVFSYPHDLAVPYSKERHALRVGAERRCNFCGRSQPEATFENEAHVMPFALGRPGLTSLSECDECNNQLSKLEGALADHLEIHRALSGLPARRGFPVAELGAKSFMKWDPTACATFVQLDPSDFGGDAVEFRVPLHKPMNVLRALARIAFFFVEEPEAYPQRMAWVRGLPSDVAPLLLRAEFDAPLARPFLVVECREIGGRTWFRTTYGFHTALFMMCVGEPHWPEPSLEQQFSEISTPTSGDDVPPNAQGHFLRFSGEDTTEYTYPFSPGAIRRPPE